MRNLTLALPLTAFGLASLLVLACGDDAASTSTPDTDAGTTPDATAPETAAPEAGADAPADAPATATVTGKVLDLAGTPVAGAKVASGGQVTTTAADGTFTLAVTPPYELVIATAQADMVWVVRGLTRLDPVLPMPTEVASSDGTLQGAIPAVAGGAGYATYFSPSAGARTSPFQLGFGAASSYSFPISWSSAADLQGTLHLLEYTGGSGNPAGTFTGYAKVDNVTLAKGQTKTVDFPGALTAVTTDSVSAVMTVPNGYAKGGSIFALARLPGLAGALAVNQSTSPSLSMSFPVPALTGATFAVLLRATGPLSGEQSVARRPVALAGTVNVALSAGATLASPADAATGVDTSTTFTWSGASGLVTLILTPNAYGTPGSPMVYVTGTATSAPLPDLAIVGAAVGSGKGYTWQVLAHPDVADADAFTKAPATDWFCNPETVTGGDDATCTYSARRAFTTK